jgi:hypothetical protein
MWLRKWQNVKRQVVPVQAIKAYRVGEVYLHSFLTLELQISGQRQGPEALHPEKEHQ